MRQQGIAAGRKLSQISVEGATLNNKRLSIIQYDMAPYWGSEMRLKGKGKFTILLKGIMKPNLHKTRTYKRDPSMSVVQSYDSRDQCSRPSIEAIKPEL